MKNNIIDVYDNLLKILIVYLLTAPIFNIIIYNYKLSKLFSALNELIVILLLIISFIAIKKIKLTRESFSIFFISLLYAFWIIIASFKSFYIRDFELGLLLNTIRIRLFPLLLFMLILIIPYKKSYIINIKEFIQSLFNIYIYLNFVFVLIELILGWEKITLFIFGSPKYSFNLLRFSHIGPFLRVPGLFSGAIGLGIFANFVFTFNLINYVFKKKKIFLFNSMISLFLIIISFNRQLYLITFIFIIILFIIKLKDKYLRFLVLFIILIIIISIFPIITNSNFSLLSTQSMNYRVEAWDNTIEDMDLNNNLSNLFFGKGGGTSGTSMNNPFKRGDNKNEGEYGLNFVDNGYLLLIHDYGVIGLFLFLLLSIYILLFLGKNHYDTFEYSVIIIVCLTLVRMVFNSIFTGQFTISFYYLFLGISLKGIIERKAY